MLSNAVTVLRFAYSTNRQFAGHQADTETQLTLTEFLWFINAILRDYERAGEKRETEKAVKHGSGRVNH